jgi:hypothetical protein
MPDFILAMEEAQKKAKCTELPILDIKLAMYAATSVLQSGNYKKEIDKWEGRNAAMKIWFKWKQAYLCRVHQGHQLPMRGCHRLSVQLSSQPGHAPSCA